ARGERSLELGGLADRRALDDGSAGRGARPVCRCAQASQSLRAAVGRCPSDQRRALGQLSADLFDGRADPDSDEAVAQLGGPFLARLIIVSNRVSVPDEGSVRAGGLEVAVNAALKRMEGTWFGWSGSISPQSKVKPRTIRQDNVTYVVSDLTAEDHKEYYNGFANRVLWPILHYQLERAEFS